MRSRIVILVMLGGIITVGVLLYTMKGRPRMWGAMPVPPSESDQVTGGGVVTWGNQQIQVAREPGPPPPQPVDPEFQKYISDEAKQVDAAHININGEAKRKELDAIGAKLTPRQAKQLLQTAESPASTSGERILSAFLMVRAGPRAQAELEALIIAPVRYQLPQEAKAAYELRSMQERSVRAMAIDGLLSRAEKEPAVRDALAKTVPGIPDLVLKIRVQKRLEEIKAHQ